MPLMIKNVLSYKETFVIYQAKRSVYTQIKKNVHVHVYNI